MLEDNKLIRMFIAGACMVVAIVISIGIGDKKETKHVNTTKQTTTETKVEVEDQEEETTQATTEEMTEAPHDTSDWEIHESENNEPDTGAKIEE